jgi:hypothetical protein
MEAATKRRRGLGLLLLAAIGVVIGALLTGVEADAIVVLGLVVAWTASACALAGLVLLTWGLLRG